MNASETASRSPGRSFPGGTGQPGNDTLVARRLGLVLVLALAIGAVYAQVLDFGFVHYDDPRYVSKNRFLRDGLTLDFLQFAFSFDPRAIYQGVSNWHPLTWLSYGLDVTLFGVDAGAMHGVNVVLHAVNTLLVFLFFDRATRAPIASAAAAMLFGIHPLHVEAVAWISERKELLSTLFGLLACHAYGTYGRAKAGGARSAYATALVCHALSLLAKPMWVTLPFLLLAVDHWPLERHGVSLRKRVLEKLPFLGLALLSSAATLHAQSDAIGAVTHVELGARIANALLAPLGYLGLSIWPAELSILYPHPFLPGGTPPSTIGWLGVAGAWATLAALAFRWRRHGFVLFGLAWFGLSLGPVIGIVQVGDQAMADRYTYVSLIGPFALACFGIREWLSVSNRGVRSAVTVLCLAGVTLLGLRAHDQTSVWRDTITLYQRSLEATPSSARMRFNLGNRLMDVGREAEAIAEYEKAAAIRPAWADPRLNLSWLLATTDDPRLVDGPRALALARAALAPNHRDLAPDANALDTLAAAEAAAGDFESAAATAKRAIELARTRGQGSAARAYHARYQSYVAGQRYIEARRAEEPR